MYKFIIYRLKYNKTNNKMEDNKFVKIYPSEFGPTKNIEYLTELPSPFSKYFNLLVKMLIELGYSKSINLIGAPYDFRKIPSIF